MSKQILIISREDDATIPFVLKHLDVPVRVVSPADIINGKELSYDFRKGKLHVIFDGTELKDIKSVWFRKPRVFWGDKLPVDPEYRHYSETAILLHTRELYVHFPDAYWMSDYYAIRRAEFKGRQLQEAYNVGFRVPDTLATSDSAAAEAFSRRHPATIVKSQAMFFPKSAAGNPTMFYSHKVTSGEKPTYSGLHLAPAIFQQAIEHDFDIRVTVVGDDVFAARIRTSGLDDLEAVRDWRPAHYYGDLDIAPYTLPPDIKDKCVALVRRLGLEYGAIDLVADKRGDIWFLENNPNGEWSFVEYATAQPIGKAIAEKLSKGRKR